MSQYKIIVETTASKVTAIDRYNILRDNQISSDILTLTPDEGELYSVQAGPYLEKKYALEHVDRIKKLGIVNAFITHTNII